MVYEYPDWIESFSCIADKCPDTCCAGWEVDIDEDTEELYLEAPEPFGSVLREKMKKDPESGGAYFPMTDKNRCPFLNDCNLCRIYIHLGPEAFSQVCDEYPRYYLEIGDYQQTDMSLSCMEYGRIVFSGGPMNLRVMEDEMTTGEDIDQERLEELLDIRDSMIGSLQLASDDQIFNRLQKLQKRHADDFDKLEESDEDLLTVMEAQEAIDPRWTGILEGVKALVEKDSFTEAESVFLEKHAEKLEDWFTKLAVYFTFRYTLDGYRDGSVDGSFRMTNRSLRFILLMCISRWERSGQLLETSDIIDIAHLYSRQVEHAEEIVEAMKGLEE